jgi:hypothetical protein
VNGLVEVGDAPGLGLELDRAGLARLVSRVPDPRHDALFLIKVGIPHHTCTNHV